MAAPSSGALSMLGFAREKQFRNYSASPGVILAKISASDLWHGGNSCNSSGENYEKSNSGQSYTTYPKPKIDAPSPATNENKSGTAQINLRWCQWYNYDQDRKGNWTTAANMPSCRAYGQSMGTTNQALISQGIKAGSTSAVVDTVASSLGCRESYEWNGASWSTGGNTPICGRYGNGGNSQTSGVISRMAVNNGSSTPSTKTGQAYVYNGTSWSSKTLTCNVAGSNYLQTVQNPSGGTISSGIGFQTSIHAGGRGSGCRVAMIIPSGTNIAHCAMANMSASCRMASGVIARARQCAIVIGGYGMISAGCGRCDTETYNGSSFSSAGNMNTRRFHFGVGSEGQKGSANFNRACVWGGLKCQSYSCANQVTEDYNGSSWSTRNNHPVCVAGQFHAGAGAAYFHFFGDCAISAGGVKVTSGVGGYANCATFTWCENSKRSANVS